MAQNRYLVSFQAAYLPHIFCDVLVVGSGVAGLRAALEAAKTGRVVLLSKRDLPEGNTRYAQGGIAAAMASGDSPDIHARDTVAAGAGFCDEAVVREVVGEGPDSIRQLMQWGACFDTRDGAVDFAREGGHSQARVLHAEGDATGREVVRVLVEKVRAEPAIRILEHTFAVDLVSVADRIAGVLAADARWGPILVWARAVILATGGAGQVYRESTNPPIATGDGVAMAWRAGAAIHDMEFYQFHPTVLYVAGASRILITEAARGEGGVLRNRHGERFMEKTHPMADLAPRDVVARAIYREMERTGDTNVYLDMTHLPEKFLRTRFPQVHAACASFDIDIARQPVPVRPGAHYMIGGVITDLRGRTTLPGLFAAGEAASTGLHGANRLASNSLLEGFVLGAHAGASAAEDARALAATPFDLGLSFRKKGGDGRGIDILDVRNSLQSVMWRYVGIEREKTGLGEALQKIDFWRHYILGKRFSAPEGWELQNLLTVARLITLSALRREETRGVHVRTDFPDAVGDWRTRHVRLVRESAEM
ncbi:MAG: L-aspartate oxidase [Planctomycetota bacterium]